MTIRYLDPWGYSGNITEYQNKERPRVVGLPTVSIALSDSNIP